MPPPLAYNPLSPKIKPRISGSPYSSSLPFDWDAALNRRPPPYASPASQRKSRKSIGTSTPLNGTPDSIAKKFASFTPKKVYRKVPVKERISNWISQIIYDIQDFPADHLPDLRKVARFLGAALHLIHFIVCYFRLRKLKDEDIGWQDMLGEISFHGDIDADSWLSWMTFVAMILIVISIANAIYLFTRSRSYLFFHKSELSNTPNAEFIDRNDLNTDGHVAPTTFGSRSASHCLHIIRALWNFAIGRKQPDASPINTIRKVQRLNIWSPEPYEIELFIIYSPLHALLWQAVSPGNWIIVSILMATTSIQLFVCHQYYSRLVKDKEILAGEVLHEYDKKFVFPHIMRVRRDACVMTDEQELAFSYD